MIALSPEAQRQVDQLIQHYETKERLEAAENLLRALERASERIAADPMSGLDAPRPYPSLARHGRRWRIEGRYWISYSLGSPPIISGVFHAQANIPGRI